MTPLELDNEFRERARRLHQGHMAELGIGPTMELAQAYNECRYGPEKAWRDHLYQTQVAQLLQENGGVTRRIDVQDGWFVDTSLSLPHLERVLEDSDRIVAERRGRRVSAKGAYRSYFQNMFTLEDAVQYPSFLDFATSSDVVAVVADYLQTIPALSTTLPPGIRLVESNAEFDDEPDRPKDSQLFHIDYYSLPNLYVLVLIEDTTLEHGPWVWYPRSSSERVRKQLGYWGAGKDYRIADADVYSLVPEAELMTFTYPRGTVLFIESSGCLHYGSRNSLKPRFQLMLGYTGACRTDFSELIMPNHSYQAPPDAPLLRRLVADKYLTAPDRPSHLDQELLAALRPRLDRVLRTSSK